MDLKDIKEPYRKWFYDYKNGDLKLNRKLSGMTEFGLTETEASYILAYTSKHSSGINSKLRDGDKLKDFSKLEYVKYLSETLKKIPSYDDKIVFRMDSPSNIEDVLNWFELNVSKSIELPFFLSTSKKQWGCNVKWQIKTLKRGSKGKCLFNLSSNPSEEEVLFDIGAKFKIVSIVNNDIICLEEVNPNFSTDYILSGVYYKNL